MQMDFNSVISAISNVGFPITLGVVSGYFIWRLGKKINDTAEKNMAELQKQSQEREEKLYKELTSCHQINGKAIETIAHYAEKLDTIQNDVKEIKSDITYLLAGGHKNDA